MEWTFFLIISVLFLIIAAVAAFVFSKSGYKPGRILDTTKILFGGVMLSSVLLFIPIYLNFFRESDCGIFETVLISVHNMIRLFLVDGEFSFITSNLDGASAIVSKLYTVLFALLFVLAPLLTFSFVLSFFKNVLAIKRYVMNYNSDVYIFSELNEKSLALATSLVENKNNKCLLVFTDVFEKDEEKNFELIEKAKELRAVCFKKDILTINFAFHSKGSELNFFAIGEDYSENINHALSLIKKHKYRDHTNLYVFSTQIESEILLYNAFDSETDMPSKIRVRRVNEIQSLVIRNLYEEGYEKIFQSAYTNEKGEKEINALIIGMGQHGTETTKALSWFCQMDGYKLEINSFDCDEIADKKFASLCPELMDQKFNGKYDIGGEARYKIKIHSDIDVLSSDFDRLVLSLPRTTYVFVSLGDDEKNISAAIKLRTLFARAGYNPVIQAIVYNTGKKEALTGITNFSGKEYNIDFIGDMSSCYTEKVILHSDVEAKALARHLKWGKEDAFWKYDYNYKSSIASAVHYKMKVKCGIPGIEKTPKERTEQEKVTIRILEHRRWNAYMRSEGYVYGGTTEPEGRNDLAKKHNFLVPFGELPPKEQEKDDD